MEIRPAQKSWHKLKTLENSKTEKSIENPGDPSPTNIGKTLWRMSHPMDDQCVRPMDLVCMHRKHQTRSHVCQKCGVPNTNCVHTSVTRCAYTCVTKCDACVVCFSKHTQSRSRNSLRSRVACGATVAPLAPTFFQTLFSDSLLSFFLRRMRMQSQSRQKQRHAKPA